MDQDYSHNKQINQLEQQLREAVASENFFETASGKIAVEIATTEINKLVQRICSDEFLKDHVGYVNAVTALHARKDWLKRLQVSASPARITRIRQKLEELEDGGE